jgi:hypothetical protein
MSKLSNLTNEVAVANQSGAMEADTISKHGRSSKSQMSKGNFFKYFGIIALAMFIAGTSSCRSVPGTFMRSDPGWTVIQLRDGLNYDKAFDDVVDVCVRSFEMEMISKESGYGRSKWHSIWANAMQTKIYQKRITFKFSSDRSKIEIKTEAIYNGMMGYDTQLLETMKQDIIAVVGR